MRTLKVVSMLLVAAPALAAEPKPKHEAPPAKGGGQVVVLCDGETSVELPAAPTAAESKAAADALMAEWRRKNPQAKWDEATVVAQNAPQQKGSAQTSPRSPPQVPPAQPPPSPSPNVQPRGPTAAAGGEEVREKSAVPEQAGHTYGAFSERDRKIWQASVDQAVEEGNRIFHDVKRLGGTTGISCDMCHPDAANTHPETYPKFQVQLGRVALLRDMINWCVENPVRAKPLADDSAEMRALESYIYAKRKGTPLEYGKH